MTEMTRRGFFTAAGAAGLAAATGMQASAQATEQQIVNTLNKVADDFAAYVRYFYFTPAGENTRQLIRGEEFSANNNQTTQMAYTLASGTIVRIKDTTFFDINPETRAEAYEKIEAVNCVINTTIDSIEKQQSEINSQAAWNEANEELQWMRQMSWDLSSWLGGQPSQNACMNTQSTIIGRTPSR